MHNILSAIFGWSQLRNINFSSSLHTHTLCDEQLKIYLQSPAHIQKKSEGANFWVTRPENMTAQTFYIVLSEPVKLTDHHLRRRMRRWRQDSGVRRRRKGTAGGVGWFSALSVCVWVYVALLWSVFPAGMAVSNRPLHCFVSNAMHKER